MLYALPTQGNALHDIRLRFSVKGIWSFLSAASTFTTDPYSKDIRLQPYRIRDLNIRVTIHKTDTVTVIVGCSYSPIAVDISGIIRLSNALTRVEERLTSLLPAEGGDGNNLISVPEYHCWDVTMWHFGADGSKEYVGEKFCVTWEVGEYALIRTYSKEMIVEGNKNKKKQKIVRLERQEYPNKSFEEAIEEKLGGILIWK